MLRRTLTLSVFPALILAGLLLAGHRPEAVAAGLNLPAAPGDLTILNNKGAASARCPLKHTEVSADLSGFVSRVTVQQQFVNPARTPVEAVYTFPLPADAAVDDMTMVIGNRIIQGEIKRRDEARALYEQAKAAGQAAALLDQERPNIFTQSVANLMPGQPVTIKISYVHLLKYDAGQYEFSFPMVVGPRYLGGSSSSGSGTAPAAGEPPAAPAPGGAPPPTPILTDPNKISPPITPQGTRAGHDISLSVRLDAGFPIQELKSQLHEVEIRKDGETKALVRLKDRSTIPNQDFILRYAVAGEQMQTGVLAHAEGKNGGFFTLILQPPAAPPQKDVAPKEMVFVIDQTGSQRGEPIKKAKETLRYCIENLNPGDTFQLIGFNTEIFPVFPQPVPVTEENVKRALDYLNPLEGNGGTDILKSVDYALRLPADPTRLRIICYMTDGYVGNDLQILEHVRKNRGQARMFVFGVGNSVNRFLIDGMAREGRGAAEVVDLHTPGEKVAAKFYARVAKPLLLDPQVEFGGLPVEDVYPKVVPDVFTSGPIIVKGRYTKAADGDITVKGILRGQPWSQTVHVAFPKEEKRNAAIPTLWAREKIEDLQAQDWLGAQAGTPDAKIQQQIVNLALDYRLMSQWTSFVAVEQRVVNIGGQQRRVEVPVEMPAGVSYEGIFGGGEGRALARGEEREALQDRLAKKSEFLKEFGRPSRGKDGRGLPAQNGAVRTEGKAKLGAQAQLFYRQAQSNAPAGGPGNPYPGGGASGVTASPSAPKPGAAGGGFGGGAAGRGYANGGSGAGFGGLGAPGPSKPAPATRPAAKGDGAARGPVGPPGAPGPGGVTPSQLRVLSQSGEAAKREVLSGMPKITGSVNVGGAQAQNRQQGVQTPRGRRLVEDKKALAEKQTRLTLVDGEEPADEAAGTRSVSTARRGPIPAKLKIAPSLRGLSAALRKPGLPEVTKGRVAVQVWVASLKPSELKKLKALGFVYTTELWPKQLVLGTIAISRLEALAKLPFVAFIEPPKFRA